MTPSMSAASPLPLGMGRCRGEGRKDGPSVRSSARPRHPPQLLLSIRCSRDQPGTGLLPPAAPPRPFRLWPAWPERGPTGPRAPLLARGRFRSAERQAAVAGRQATPDPPAPPSRPRGPRAPHLPPRTCGPSALSTSASGSSAEPSALLLSPRISVQTSLSPARFANLCPSSWASASLLVSWSVSVPWPLGASQSQVLSALPRPSCGQRPRWWPAPMGGGQAEKSGL